MKNKQRSSLCQTRPTCQTRLTCPTDARAPRRSSLLTAHCSLLLLALAALCATGCPGYIHHFALPPGAENARTIAIDIFKNKTLYQDIDFQLTAALEREISAVTPLRIASHASADLLLRGAVESYDKVVLRKNKFNEVSRYSIVITASYELIRQPADGQPEKVISSAKKVSWSIEFEVQSTITEADARARAVRRVAREVISRAFEPWPAKE